MAGRFLLIGDIHIGRMPLNLPETLGAAAAYSPAAAWHDAVQWGVDQGVDAVLLAGDVVEALEDRFEAYQHLSVEVQRLAGAGIDVVAVAGNHDVQALPRLARHIAGLHLLGADGDWGEHCVYCKDGSTVRFLGWSFQEGQDRACRRNPLETLAFTPDGIPTFGVLHCDLDAAGSQYAPVPRAALEATLVDGWFLGHIHKPTGFSAVRPIGYLGSLTGLDSGESGLRGPWLMSWDGKVELQQIQLGALRWESIDVALDDVAVDGDDAADALYAHILQGMRELHERISPELGRARAVACRVYLMGRSLAHQQLVQRSHALIHAVEEIAGVAYYVEKVIDTARPALDLIELARGNDPIALLSRKLLALQDRAPEGEMLIAEATQAIKKRLHSRLVLRAEALKDPEAVRAVLIRAGLSALETIQSQPVEGGA